MRVTLKARISNEVRANRFKPPTPNTISEYAMDIPMTRRGSSSFMGSRQKLFD